jgi:uncharacterized protein (DUF849 family)
MIIGDKIDSSSILTSASQQTLKTQSTSFSFAQALEEKQQKVEKDLVKNDAELEIQANQKILEEIFSLIQTGLTKTELEELNKLTQKIKESMKKEDVNENETKDLLKQLEDMMLQFQKRLTNGTLLKTEDKNSVLTSNDAMSSNITSMITKLDELSKQNEELKTYNRLVRQHGELELLEALKEAV